ncbi:hypothetical protein E2C01_074916 [Portunus trituberculatus]|uniref:Uncharacterized protein n=1 Tax=Portunus trituberculatus TaxID=210409 RepID=A0A5B7IHQ7_PORTR|nr:hypothetical protein [Portunus trituberculatus]
MKGRYLSFLRVKFFKCRKGNCYAKQRESKRSRRNASESCLMPPERRRPSTRSPNSRTPSWPGDAEGCGEEDVEEKEEEEKEEEEEEEEEEEGGGEGGEGGGVTLRRKCRKVN